MSRVVEADLTWTGAAFEPGLQVRIDPDGRIGGLGRLVERPDQRLERMALIPGMVNAHSHAFQRGLRGAGERFPEGAGSFWTWREAMYRLVAQLDGASFRRLATQAFLEMRAAGVTTVGEFHYLHHREPGDFGFDDCLLEAARDAGIRLVLLNTYYRTGGVGTELTGGQLRFGIESTEAYWRQMDALGTRITEPVQTLGAVVHSLRAASPEELGELGAEARSRGLILHLHLEEQRREIEEVRDAYGATPMAVLLDRVAVGPWLTAVHCTHTDPGELESYLERGGRICVCPLTEANLGDGLPPLVEAGAQPRSLALGSDSNLRISMLEEMRWLEYGQRLRTLRRGALRGDDGSVGRTLFEIASEGGARSLAVDCGRIEPGLWADFAALDLEHASLAGWTPETLLDTFVFGAADGCIAGTCVGGEWLWSQPAD